MSQQKQKEKNQTIRDTYISRELECPQHIHHRINLSWINWGFGVGPLAVSARRLHASGLRFIELHGNRYGDDLGYRPHEIKSTVSTALRHGTTGPRR